jgi:hypothetical protein
MTWRRDPQDPLIRRLTVTLRLRDRIRRRGLDSSAIDEEVQQAQAEVDRIRNDIWRRTWAIPYALAVYWAQVRP